MVRFSLPDGTEAEVGPSGIIGRLFDAALCIDDPRVSEAHAMVSLRGGQLYLLALRGPLVVGRQRVPHVLLQPDQRIELVKGIALTVTGLWLPESVLAIAGAGERPVPLLQSVYSITADRPPRLVAGYQTGAAGWIWSAGMHRAQLRGQEGFQLVAGTRFDAPGGTLTAIDARLDGTPHTISSATRGPSMRIIARYETAHLHREDGLTVSISGVAARILTELVQFNAPVPWEMVAAPLWPDEPDLFVVRRNWDRHLKYLRGRLRRAGFRTNLIRSDGRGNAELFLMPGDTVHNES